MLISFLISAFCVNHKWVSQFFFLYFGYHFTPIFVRFQQFILRLIWKVKAWMKSKKKNGIRKRGIDKLLVTLISHIWIWLSFPCHCPREKIVFLFFHVITEIVILLNVTFQRWNRFEVIEFEFFLLKTF